MANEHNEELIRKLLNSYGYSLIKDKYTHPEYPVRCVDYYVLG